MKRHMVPVQAVEYGDLLLEAKADDTHIVYVERVNSTWRTDVNGREDENGAYQVVMTDNGYARYTFDQQVTILRGV